MFLPQHWLNECPCVDIFLIFLDIFLIFVSSKDFSESEMDVCGWVEVYSCFQSAGCRWKTLMNSFHFLPLYRYTRSLQRTTTIHFPFSILLFFNITRYNLGSKTEVQGCNIIHSGFVHYTSIYVWIVLNSFWRFICNFYETDWCILYKISQSSFVSCHISQYVLLTENT